MSARCLGAELPALPVLLSSPHSGRIYPDWFLTTTPLEPGQLRPLDDGPTDLLLEGALRAGAGAVCALYPRAVVDLNRSMIELDPGLLPPRSGRSYGLTPKVRVGLGVIPTRVGAARIYAGPLSETALQRRFDDAYKPYHAVLKRRLGMIAEAFGAALLLDVHSMPDSLAVVDGRRVDAALGDRFGRSCNIAVARAATRRLTAEGLACAANQPYAGGHITERYGEPAAGRSALQIEIRRGLFWNERTDRVDPAGVERLSAILGRLVIDLGAVLAPRAVESAA